jgi:hypothetical protein
MAEHSYKDFPFIFTSKGIVARYALDRCPEGTYLNLQNLECQQENALTSRLGHSLINFVDSIIGKAHTLARLKGLGLNTWRYVGTFTNGNASPIYRSSSIGGDVFSSVFNGMSGSKFSTAAYRPDFSAQPWIFFADSNAMVKDNGTLGTLNRWGILQPFRPATTVLFGAGGLNSTGGIAYDYRYTYYNVNTGAESNPSVVQIAANTLSPVNQGITITYLGSTDPQVTHIRIYRRGGTLANGWLFVMQVVNPIGLGSVIDSNSDASIASSFPLQIDNDPPITSTLPMAVNTTIPAGVPLANTTQTVTPISMMNISPNQQVMIDILGFQETVIVQSIVPGLSFTAYFQASHAASVQVAATTVTAQPVNLCANAFEQMWLAGDPNNPNRLYYSKRQRPESFPPQNYIEIGVPSDPIMAVVAMRGQLFAFTLSRVYSINVYPGLTPTAYPTGSRHGMILNFAWCIAENQIWYRSQDGIYAFNGSNSVYMSLELEWLLGGKEGNFNSPLSVDAVDPLSTAMCFNRNEIFYSYTKNNYLGGPFTRLIYDLVYKRWRNDNIQASCMLTEEDTGNMIFSRSTAAADSFVYQDRVGNVDNDFGGPTPIVISLQTPALDLGFPKNSKVFNEFTLDADTGDSIGGVTANLIFDLGLQTQQTVGPFVFANNGRIQIPYKINAGAGVVARTVSLTITGTPSTPKPITLYEVHIKAAVEAEFRQSFDSYWIKFGTDEFKICKQSYFEYVAPDAAGVSFSVYTEGDMTVPSFTFTLPKATVRTSTRIRFPAVKAKVWRWIATSASNFQMYGESFIEFKPITTSKGYMKENFGNISAQSNV